MVTMVRVVRRWYETPRARRIIRAAVYASVTILGVGAWANSPEALEAALGPLLVDAWALYVVAGAGQAFAGALTDKWMGEYVGLVLVLTALFVWALALFAYSDDHPWKLAEGLAVSALGLALLDRWLDVRAVARVAGQVVNCERE